MEGDIIKIAIVGSPNVGKSVLFNSLTDSYAAVVSNYPGTTVEIYRGRGRIGERAMEVIDTPGMYSLVPVTEEERVARSILLNECPRIVLHVVDANNLERMLPFTIQLAEAGLPIILVLNMMDEVEKSGKKIKIDGLREELGIPVVPTVCTTGRGLDILRGTIESYARQDRPKDIV